MLLDACSIRTVYSGVLDAKELAVTNSMAKDTRTAPVTAKDTFRLSIFSPPFNL